MRRTPLLLAVGVLAITGTRAAVAVTGDAPLPAGVGYTVDGRGTPQPLDVPLQNGAPELPPGAPPAAAKPEPPLPAPAGWTFGDGFPRTSGAGRYLNSAYFWSDFLYDDNGAIGVQPATNESSGAPSNGTYKYPEPDAAGNGADIFRVAIGHKGQTTTWRVDWNTLVDRGLPAAVFAIDLDHDTTTGTSAWPGNAGLTSPGIDKAIVLTGSHSWLYGADGSESDLGATTVDTAARSFMVSIPDGALPRSTSASSVQVAAGLANDTHDALKTLDTDHGAAPNQPNVYNVAFRDYTDESPIRNAWFDTAQTSALTNRGDVSAFAAELDWAALDAKRSDPEPLFSGYTNRWYVSSIEVGQGIGAPPAGFDDGIAYLGRVQPYGIFVPSTYDGSPTPLTWMLHGSLSNHNSAPGVSPRFLDHMCEARGSICISPLGRGPNGGYSNEAELDFWEVWNRVGSNYALDPDRTILSGYSMGGYGTYKIAMDHPDLFVAAAPLAANAVDENIDGNIVGVNTGEDSGVRPGRGLHRVPNLRWTPLYMWQGAVDELVPADGAIRTSQRLDAEEQRYILDLYPAQDHVVSAVEDGFDDVAAFMSSVDQRYRQGRERRPGHITYTFYAPTAKETSLGLGAAGAWWVSGVAVRDTSDRLGALVDADSKAIPRTAVALEPTVEARPDAHPTPAVRRTLDWAPAGPSETASVIDLQLRNTSAVGLDLRAAGLTGTGSIPVTTPDGPTTVTLTKVASGTTVLLDGVPVSGADGRYAVNVPVGVHTIMIV